MQKMEDEEGIYDNGMPEINPDDEEALLYSNIPTEEEETPDTLLPPGDFNENLAETLEDSVLSGLGARLIDLIEQDLESRSDWEQKTKSALEYLGTTVETFRNTPFLYACSAFDTTMLSALLKSYASTKQELFPSSGPVRTGILGPSDSQLDISASNIKDSMNYYLTVVDTPYYPNSDRLILYRNFFGSAFRKVWQDPISNLPIARLVTPQDLIVNNDTDCLMESDRITQCYDLSRKDVILRQINGVFKDVALPGDEEGLGNDDSKSDLNSTIKRISGIDTNSNEKRSTISFYECHTNLTEEDLGKKPPNKKEVKDLPCPYIVTICKANNKIMSIRRNWKEGDATYKKLTYFVHYQYLPGFGIYSLGLAHIIGSNSIALTSMIRQLIDSGSLSAFPGFLVEKGLRTAKNNKTPSPGEGVEIDTGGRPLSEVVMPFPYKEPSVVINQLRKDVINETLQAAGAAEIPLGENMANTPAATTMAAIDVANRLQTATLRSFHSSLSHELQLLYNLFKQNLSGPFTAKLPGKSVTVTPSDFSDDIRVYPVSDDNVNTTTQRLIANEAILRLAEAHPELHDFRQIYHRIYSTMGIPEIDKILPPAPEPMPLNPVTENMNMMQGKPAKAQKWQAHDAHITIHSLIPQDPNMTPEKKALAMSHISEHLALKFLMQIEEALGAPLPPEQASMNPEIQNQISMMVAPIAQQMAQSFQQQQPPSPSPDSQLLAQTEEKKSLLQHENARLKAETESFKATLKHEEEREKMETQRDIANEKNRTDVLVEKMKHESNPNEDVFIEKIRDDEKYNSEQE